MKLSELLEKLKSVPNWYWSDPEILITCDYCKAWTIKIEDVRIKKVKEEYSVEILGEK